MLESWKIELTKIRWWWWMNEVFLLNMWLKQRKETFNFNIIVIQLLNWKHILCSKTSRRKQCLFVPTLFLIYIWLPLCMRNTVAHMIAQNLITFIKATTCSTHFNPYFCLFLSLWHPAVSLLPPLFGCPHPYVDHQLSASYEPCWPMSGPDSSTDEITSRMSLQPQLCRDHFQMFAFIYSSDPSLSCLSALCTGLAMHAWLPHSHHSQWL